MFLRSLASIALVSGFIVLAIPTQGCASSANEVCNGSGQCVCKGDCSKSCDSSDGSGCSFVCEAGATCSFTCKGGNCQASGDGSIAIDCPKGGCRTSCSGPSCKVTSCTQSCTTACGNATVCSSSCTDTNAGCVTSGTAASAGTALDAGSGGTVPDVDAGF